MTPDFCIHGQCTQGLSCGDGEKVSFKAFDESNANKFESRDTPDNEFTKPIDRAKDESKVRNLFEDVFVANV